MLNVAHYLSLIFCVVSIVVLASVAPCCHNRHLPPTLPLIASSAFFVIFVEQCQMSPSMCLSVPESSDT